LRSMEVEE
jgi:serine/threonine-protein phosphatase 2A regulatory subunit B